MQFSTLLEHRRRNTNLLLGLSDRRIKRGLARLDLAARPIDFARAESALLADEEYAAVLDDEAKVGPLARLPALPFRRWNDG
jgi:hypothetical protein